MTDRPLVSIVTPTLNQGQFIEATIGSIKAQTYDRFEHIVIDGGSTDGTLDILRRHEGTYPMRWQSEPDRGMYDAVNKGMRQATGDILCYLNSDDLYFPWTLETVVDAFRRWPEADFVFGDAVSIDEQSGQNRLFVFSPIDLDHLRRHGFLAQPAVMWRRAAFDCEGEFDQTLRYVADCEYWMRSGAHHRFAKVNEFLAIERRHEGTLHATTSGAVEAELAAVRNRFASSTQDPSWVAAARTRARAKSWFTINWAMLGLQSRMPRSWRTRWWRRFLDRPGTRIHGARIAVMLVPILGRGQFDRIADPSRYWLDPPSP